MLMEKDDKMDSLVNWQGEGLGGVLVFVEAYRISWI